MWEKFTNCHVHSGLGRLELMEPEKLMGCKRGGSPRLDLRLNLSPVNSTSSEMLTSSNNNSSEMSVEGSSCVSWEAEDHDERVETRTMVLVGCRRCLMYVLLSDVDPKCPKCNSTVLLDFLNDDTSSTTAAATKPNN